MFGLILAALLAVTQLAKLRFATTALVLVSCLGVGLLAFPAMRVGLGGVIASSLSPANSVDDEYQSPYPHANFRYQIEVSVKIGNAVVSGTAVQELIMEVGSDNGGSTFSWSRLRVRGDAVALPLADGSVLIFPMFWGSEDQYALLPLAVCGLRSSFGDAHQLFDALQHISSECDTPLKAFPPILKLRDGAFEDINPAPTVSVRVTRTDEPVDDSVLRSIPSLNTQTSKTTIMWHDFSSGRPLYRESFIRETFL